MVFRRIIDVARANIAERLRNAGQSQRRTYRQQQTHSNSNPWEEARYTSDPDPEPGPPPGQDPVIAQYYANLEIPYGSDLATVRQAWKSQLAKYHPDRHHGDPEKREVAEQVSRELNHAYDALVKHLKA